MLGSEKTYDNSLEPKLGYWNFELASCLRRSEFLETEIEEKNSEESARNLPSFLRRALDFGSRKQQVEELLKSGATSEYEADLMRDELECLNGIKSKK